MPLKIYACYKTFVPGHITHYASHHLRPQRVAGGYPRGLREESGLPAEGGPAVVEVIEKMTETADLREYQGKEEHYPNFLSFFQRQIDQKGVAAVLNEYVFAETEQAENILCRLWGGLLPPMISHIPQYRNGKRL